MRVPHLLFSVALLCYFLSSCGYWWNVRRHRRTTFVLATIGVAVGFLTQTVALLLYAQAVGRPPFATFSEVLNVFSWVVALVYLAAEMRYRTGSLGNFLIPLAFLATFFALLMFEHTVQLDPKVRSVWFGMHIIFAFAGLAAFALIFGAGLMYIIQESQLKSKKIGAFYYRLPSLESLDGINATAQSLGFPFLTFGLIAGAIWAGAAKGSLLRWDPQYTLPLLVTWLMYAVLFIGRLAGGWRGRKPSVLAVVGFCVAVLTYFIHTAK